MQRAGSIVILALLAPVLLGCRVDRDPGAEKASRSVTFGKPLSGLPRTPLAEVLAHPERYADRTIAVEGRVARACTRKGCWMEIADGTSDGAPSCRVTFEDYSFFVPKDSPGARALLEGKVVTSRVKASHVEHLESEGARFSSKNADGSALEVQIVATGVELEKPATKSPAPSSNGAQGT